MLTRWLKFNLVGAVGIGVQLGCLALLRPHLQYLAATALAVEIAVLHNFAWHERFTWRGCTDGRWWPRLARFHLSNGAVSIVGNLAAMWLLVGQFHMRRMLVANGIAIAACSLLNFVLAECFVFHPQTVPSARRLL